MWKSLIGCAAFALGALAVQEGDDAQLWACGANAAGQGWLIESGAFPLSHITLIGSANASQGGAFLVLDIGAWSNATDSEIHVWYNTTGNQGYNQQWRYNASSGLITSLMSGQCAAAGGTIAGMPVRTQPCNPADPLQQFDYNTTSAAFQFRADHSLCLDAGAIASCSLPPYSSYTYCNQQASTEARVADLVARLLPADIQNLLSNSNIGIPRFGVPRVPFGECLHGPLTGCGAPYTDPTTGYTSSGCPSSFPHVLATGGSLNRSLWQAIGHAIGVENRALHNQGGIQGSIFWAPDINPFRG